MYTFAMPKLQLTITSEIEKALIQMFLLQPDILPAITGPPEHCDTRMSASGYEETDLNNIYQEVQQDTR